MAKRYLLRVASLCLVLLLVACAPTETAAPDLLANIEQVKLLATVELSPTPDDAQREATRAVQALQPPTPFATPLPSPTAYIGVFLGEAGDTGAPQPEFDTARFVTTVPLTAATVTAAACAIQPDTRYGSAWGGVPAIAASIGCAGETAADYPGTTQLFEQGLMLFIPSGEIWALAPSIPSGRYWYVVEAPPGDANAFSAPEGLRLPAQGFGAVWGTNVNIRDTLGFARTDEASATLIVQRFVGGTLIQDASIQQTFVLLAGGDSGVLYGPF
jgi:hypothetical protein